LYRPQQKNKTKSLDGLDRSDALVVPLGGGTKNAATALALSLFTGAKQPKTHCRWPTRRKKPTQRTNKAAGGPILHTYTPFSSMQLDRSLGIESGQ
jgi:hypothetical protein